MPTHIDDERQDMMLAVAQPKVVIDPPPPAKSPVPMLALGAVGVVALIAFLVWPRGGEAAVASPTALPTSAPTTVPAKAAPTYTDISSNIALINSQLGSGDYKGAISTAEGTLGIAGVREEDRRALTGYIVTAGLKDLYTHVSDPLDVEQQQDMVDTYLKLKERAKGAGITIDTPLQMAKSSHSSSHFQLARVGLEEAYTDGSFNPKTDRDVTRLYVSVLFGLGEWYTKAEEDSPLYQDGLRWLVTSDMVADEYKTGQSDAEALLGRLGYVERATWPEPMSTPLLP